MNDQIKVKKKSEKDKQENEFRFSFLSAVYSKMRLDEDFRRRVLAEAQRLERTPAQIA